MTNEIQRVEAPTAAEIEERFSSPTVRIVRPVILGGLSVLCAVRRFGWSAEGIEQLADLPTPLIFAANHMSHADTAAILGTLPPALRRRTCVAAALDVFGPAAGSRRTVKALRRECIQIIVAAGFHAFAFDRQGPPLRSLRTAVELVRSGWSVVLYPEGTRSRTGALGPFKAGVGVMAKMTGCLVVPVHVSGGTTILACGRTVPGPGHARVRYGAPIRHRPGEQAAEFTDRLRNRIGALAPDHVEVRPGPETRPAPEVTIETSSLRTVAPGTGAKQSA